MKGLHFSSHFVNINFMTKTIHHLMKCCIKFVYCCGQYSFFGRCDNNSPTPIDGKMCTQRVLLLKGFDLSSDSLSNTILDSYTMHNWIACFFVERKLWGKSLFILNSIGSIKGMARHIHAIWHREKPSKDTCTPIGFDVHKQKRICKQ